MQAVDTQTTNLENTCSVLNSNTFLYSSFRFSVLSVVGVVPFRQGSS
jgi:hypothetical protein